MAQIILSLLMVLFLVLGCQADSPAPTPTPTLEPSPTTAATPLPATADGWLTYQNSFYSYEISYPPEAHIETEGVWGFPTEEQPAEMTFEQYLNQLRQTYPDDICLAIQYQSGFVIILAPLDQGGQYVRACPGLGIGVYDLIEQSESIVIEGVAYMAEGYELRQQDETAAWHGEVFSFHLDDGTRITFGGTAEATHEAYLETRETLLEIVTSYRKN